MEHHPLRTYRKDKGISLEAIAAKAKVTRTSLSRIERGLQTPSLDLVGRIITATDGALSADDFLRKVAA